MSDAAPKNPYNPAHVYPNAPFVGRGDTLHQLVDNGILTGRSYGLVGDPGIGKTSLALVVRERLMATTEEQPRLFLPVYIQCQREEDSLESILEKMVTGLIDALPQSRHPAFSGGFRSELGHCDRTTWFDDALTTVSERVFEISQKTCQPVFLIDALHRLNESRCLPRLAKVLTPVVDTKRIVVLLIGQRPLVEDAGRCVSTLRSLLTREFPLNPLTPQETAELVQLASKHGWDVESGCADTVHEMTSGHPYRLQYYLHVALSEYGRLNSASLSRVHTRDTIQRLDSILGVRRVDSSNRSMVADAPVVSPPTDDIKRPVRELQSRHDAGHPGSAAAAERTASPQDSPTVKHAQEADRPGRKAHANGLPEAREPADGPHAAHNLARCESFVLTGGGAAKYGFLSIVTEGKSVKIRLSADQLDFIYCLAEARQNSEEKDAALRGWTETGVLKTAVGCWRDSTRGTVTNRCHIQMARRIRTCVRTAGVDASWLEGDTGVYRVTMDIDISRAAPSEPLR